MTRMSTEQESQDSVVGVLQNHSFLFLWIAQALSQVALNATIYILMVQVEEWTGSSTALGLLIFSFIFPSVLFGPAAGVFVDRWPKKLVLLVTNLLRAVIVASFALLARNFLLVLVVNLFYSAVSQFFIPAEIASIPAIVAKKQLVLANGLFNLTLSGAQLVGFVFVGPLLAKGIAGHGVFLLLAIVYGLCAVLVALIPLQEPPRQRSRVSIKAGILRPVMDELREGWRLLVHDQSVSLSVMHLILVNSLVLVIGMLAPGYVARVLGIRADDSVYVMAPAGIGMLVGIGVLHRLARRWPKESIATYAVFLTAGVLLGLGAAGHLSRMLREAGYMAASGPFNLSPLIGLILFIMVLALVLGFGYALVNVSAQTLVQERVPPELRGRIFATQYAFANAAAVLPLLFMGGLADLIGISQVTLIASVVVCVAGGYSLSRTRSARMP